MGFSLRKLMPVRDAQYAEVVVDLDKMIAEPVAFRFDGRNHVVKAIDTETFMTLTEAFNRMESLQHKKGFKAEELAHAYYELISSVCPSVTKKMILSMSQAQVGALIQLVLDTATGRVHGEKKNPMMPKQEKLTEAK